MTGHGHPPKNVTLRGFRLAWGLNVQDAADRLGVDRQTLASWESGASRPTAEQLVRLARAYRLAVEDLLPAIGGEHDA